MTSEDLSTKPEPAKVDRLRQLEIWLCMALAFSLHLSLTASWIILIVGSIVTCTRPNLSQRLQMVLRAPLTLPLLIFVFAIAVSTLINGGLADAKQIFTNSRSFLIYIYVYQAFATDFECLKKALAIFLCTGALAGLYGMVQQLFNFHPFTYPYLQATGFLQAPMPFAGIMQITSFLALGLYMKDGYTVLGKHTDGMQFFSGIFKAASPQAFGLCLRRGFVDLGRCRLGDKPCFALITLANFMGLFFACERSAWLGMVIGIFAVTAAVSPRTLVKVSLVSAVALATVWFCVPAVKARLGPLEHWQSDVSVSTRFKVWKRAGDIFLAHPAFGVGPSHFPSITDIPEALVPGRSTDLNHAHSNYFQVLSTLGLVGLAAFLFLLVRSLLAALTQSIDPSWRSGIGIGTFGALVSLLVAGIFEYNFGAGQVKLAQWFLLAAIDPKRDTEMEQASSTRESGMPTS